MNKAFIFSAPNRYKTVSLTDTALPSDRGHAYKTEVFATLSFWNSLQHFPQKKDRNCITECYKKPE